MSMIPRIEIVDGHIQIHVHTCDGKPADAGSAVLLRVIDAIHCLDETDASLGRSTVLTAPAHQHNAQTDQSGAHGRTERFIHL